MGIKLNEQKVTLPVYGTSNNIGTLSVPITDYKQSILTALSYDYSVFLNIDEIILSGSTPKVELIDNDNDTGEAISTFRITNSNSELVIGTDNKSICKFSNGGYVSIYKNLTIGTSTSNYGLRMYDRATSKLKRVYIEDDQLKIEDA
jgi:hypothetical protein